MPVLSSGAVDLRSSLTAKPTVQSNGLSRLRWRLSQDHPFDVAEGEGVNFRCHGAMIWPRYVVSIVKPDLAISLKRE